MNGGHVQQKKLLKNRQSFQLIRTFLCSNYTKIEKNTNSILQWSNIPTTQQKKKPGETKLQTN